MTKLEYRAYYKKNKLKIQAYQKAYREAHKKYRITEYNRAYYKKNKLKIAAYQKAYREAHKKEWFGN